MSKRKPTIISSGGNSVRVHGEVSGVVVGDGASVSMTFNGDAEPSIVVHRGVRVNTPTESGKGEDKNLLAKLLGL